ncbi:hypothetical protein BpHYR1_040560 [Brachionus plicatilis]|uniref:Uncharacterized protein n=1 Tax=Brachionus plicatilis TaxID=10195 RepID=A0A3M7PE30_BRAPC|nr:hypothetical protein BpHYR1_040560 [Brachionus plicatilis]
MDYSLHGKISNVDSSEQIDRGQVYNSTPLKKQDYSSINLKDMSINTPQKKSIEILEKNSFFNLSLDYSLLGKISNVDSSEQIDRGQVYNSTPLKKQDYSSIDLKDMSINTPQKKSIEITLIVI